MKVLPAFFVVVLLAACGSASGNGSGHSAARPFALGINVSPFGPYEGTGPFMNLIYGSSWQMKNASGGASGDVPEESLDSDGWVKSLPPDKRVSRALAVPFGTGKFVCRYKGSGSLDVSGSAVSEVSKLAGETRFTLANSPSQLRVANLTYSVVAPNYIRGIDCRAAAASPTETFTPEFLSALSGFSTVRFMKWQMGTEGNWPVTWAKRTKPGDADYLKNDGVPVELLIEAANQAHADLWVTMPWNADNQYVRNFATTVKDKLAPGHQVYVEVSNEVWNGGYAVARQAAEEAKAESLPPASGSGMPGSLERYAEKTSQVMAIWSKVFAGQQARLVRVASFQHVAPYFSGLLLKYMDLHESIDAFATAPYFGFEAKDDMSLDQIMAALPGQAAAAVKEGLQQKAIAAKYGLRYLTYEGGQTVLLPKNVLLEQQVERDPRMYDVYRDFISDWRSQIGDQLNLFALSGQIGQYGGWGLVEYLGQPVSGAPKMRAVQDSIRASEVRTRF
jgi:hypothetical protein